MNNFDREYCRVLKKLIEDGVHKPSRAGDVRSLFGLTMKFDLSQGIPLLTTKKVFVKGIIKELLWFISGSTNIKPLVDDNVHIWTPDAYRYYLELVQKHNDAVKYNESYLSHSAVRELFNDAHVITPISSDVFVEKVKKGERLGLYTNENVSVFNPLGIYRTYSYGDLGEIYGRQLRRYGTSGLDQLQRIVDILQTNPDDRRMIINFWNPDFLDKVALPACHAFYEFNTEIQDNGRRKLNCMFICRSNDFCAGNPYNIVEASILTLMIAKLTDMDAGELTWVGGDVHIYENHVENAKLQLERNGSDEIPQLIISGEQKTIDDFKYEDFHIENYYPDESISYKLNVGLNE